jgi:repressor LexA
MERLSPRQRDVLDTILARVRGEGRFPSVREIGAALGIRSPATVSQHLKALLRKGFLEQRGRHYVLTGSFLAPKGIPVVGRVAAGYPITSPEHVEEWLGVENLSRGAKGDTFAVKVMGDSMVDAGILDGDYVLVDPRGDLSNGQIVVAYVGEEQEVTVKRFRRTPSGVELRPENPTFSTLEVPATDPHFRIAGRVVGLVRRF